MLFPIINQFPLDDCLKCDPEWTLLYYIQFDPFVWVYLARASQESAGWYLLAGCSVKGWYPLMLLPRAEIIHFSTFPAEWVANLSLVSARLLDEKWHFAIYFLVFEWNWQSFMPISHCVFFLTKILSIYVFYSVPIGLFIFTYLLKNK